MEILTENGTVSGIKGNYIIVQIPKKPECEECRSIFCSKSDAKINSIEIETGEKFLVGDEVEIQLQGRYLVKASLLFFVIPLLIIIISITCFQLIISNTVISSFFGFLLVTIYYLTIRAKRVLDVQPKISKMS